MKRRMLKYSLLLTMCLLLMTGCGKNELPEDTAPLLEHIVLVDIVSENVVSENNASVSEVSENLISENEESEVVYYIEEDDIVNLQEAFANWSDIDDIQREINMDTSYVDCDVPTQLQDILIYRNDGIEDERDEACEEYFVEREIVSEEDMANLPIEDIMLNCHDYITLCVIDIDGDGEDEYYHSVQNGNHGGSYWCFHKNVEGTWMEITVCNSSFGRRLLFYEDRYYIWSGRSTLYWWNDEIERIPTMDTIDGNPCWNTLVLQRNCTDYTPYELYSNIEDESIDFLENVKLNCYEFADNNDTLVNVVSSLRFGWEDRIEPVVLKYSWERTYNSERYLYLDINREITIPEYNYLSFLDRQLVIMHQTEEETWEIVKVYYLMEGCDRSLVQIFN